MSKRSRAQREIERAHSVRLSMAKQDPAQVMFPSECSTEKGCHRPTKIALIIKQGHAQYGVRGACAIHLVDLVTVFELIGKRAELIQEETKLPGAARLPVTPAEPSESAPVPELPESLTSTSGNESPTP